MTRFWCRSMAVAVIAMAGLAAGDIAAQTSGTSERFTAFAVNMGNLGRAQAGPVEMVVTRWSTPAERERLIGTLLDRGADALLDELRDTRRVGYIRTPNSIGYDLHYAQEIPAEDGGRRIVLVTDRPIGFWEAAYQPRTIDYPFTLIELRVNRDGEGEGKMSIATRITADKARNLIELEDYARQPLRLMAVHSTKQPTS